MCDLPLLISSRPPRRRALSGTAAVAGRTSAAAINPRGITMDDKRQNQQFGEQRHFSDRHRDNNQQSQSSGSGQGGGKRGGSYAERIEREAEGEHKGDHDQGGKNNEQSRHTDKGDGM
jgi:hypothetical protein